MDPKTLQKKLDAGLPTTWLGRPLHVHATLGSTNDEAKRLGDSGAPHGTVVITLEQTAGRGRRGRSWTDLGGAHVFVSMLLSPELPIERVAALPLVIGLGVAEALETLEFKPELKWPNDVELGGKKVAGILCELTTDTSGDLAYVVAGLGLNVDAPTAALPADVAERFTSLSIVRGGPVSLDDLYLKLFSSIESRLDLFTREGFTPLKYPYERRLSLRHEYVRALAGHVVEGVCVGVSDSGELLVRETEGALERIGSGEVERVRRA